MNGIWGGKERRGDWGGGWLYIVQWKLNFPAQALYDDDDGKQAATTK